MIRNFDATAREGRPLLVCQQPLTIPTVLADRQDWRGCGLRMTLHPGDSREATYPQPRARPHDPRSFCVEQGPLPQSFRLKSSCSLLFSRLLSFLMRAKCVSCLMIHMLSDTLFRFYEPLLGWCEERISVCCKSVRLRHTSDSKCDGSARHSASVRRQEGLWECSCRLPGMQSGECGQAKE